MIDKTKLLELYKGLLLEIYKSLFGQVGQVLAYLKETVSPDIGLHFSFWKIKLVLCAGPLMVLTFFYFVVPEIF
jgi:hypothetical protein